MKKLYLNFIINIALPLFVGGFIYILFRNESLIMFDWFDKLGLLEPIKELREIINPIKPYMANWIYFSLADGLWTYAFTSAFLLFGDRNRYWLALPFLLSIGVEMLQYLGLFKGTYDPLDLLFCVIGYVLPFIVFKPLNPITFNI